MNKLDHISIKYLFHKVISFDTVYHHINFMNKVAMECFKIVERKILIRSVF